jgi:lysophospholipase L1-like esterase
VLYHIYSGHLFFSAATLFLAATAADFAGLRVRRIAAILALLAIPLAGLSGTPMPMPLAIAVLIATIAYVFIGFGARARLRYPLGTAAIIAVILVCAVELPFHLRFPHGIHASRLFVIGDSLSSGGFGERTPWPKLLGIPVTNLALPSDTTTMALQNQIPLLPPPVRGDCVIIEIGGNDMFEGVPSDQFAKALHGILAAARAGGQRTVILLELPLLPGRWRYGAIQRRLAAKQAVILVPKRVLANALLGRGNTSDGIHLLQPGHDALARDLGSIFGATSVW